MSLVVDAVNVIVVIMISKVDLELKISDAKLEECYSSVG